MSISGIHRNTIHNWRRDNLLFHHALAARISDGASRPAKELSGNTHPTAPHGIEEIDRVIRNFFSASEPRS